MQTFRPDDQSSTPPSHPPAPMQSLLPPQPTLSMQPFLHLKTPHYPPTTAPKSLSTKTSSTAPLPPQPTISLQSHSQPKLSHYPPTSSTSSPTLPPRPSVPTKKVHHVRTHLGSRLKLSRRVRKTERSYFFCEDGKFEGWSAVELVG